MGQQVRTARPANRSRELRHVSDGLLQLFRSDQLISYDHSNSRAIRMT
jgi:hypothetical protein